MRFSHVVALRATHWCVDGFESKDSGRLVRLDSNASAAVVTQELQRVAAWHRLDGPKMFLNRLDEIFAHWLAGQVFAFSGTLGP